MECDKIKVEKLRSGSLCLNKGLDTIVIENSFVPSLMEILPAYAFVFGIIFDAHQKDIRTERIVKTYIWCVVQKLQHNGRTAEIVT